MTVQDLPALNASLNALATVFLVTGWVLIRQRKREAHRACMLAAFAVSTAFLASYLTYHFNVGSVPFQKQGLIRTVYLAILLTHIVLAIVIVPLIFMSLSRALSSRFDRHRRIARWTLPLWLYVSVTGVIVYLMLYRM
jgi:putative membrane protein